MSSIVPPDRPGSATPQAPADPRAEVSLASVAPGPATGTVPPDRADEDADEDDCISTLVPPPRALVWDAWGMTNAGKLRQVNEDAFLLHPSQSLWLVADGMGGHARGDLASSGIARAFDRLVLPERLSDCADLVEATLLEINAGLGRLAAAAGAGETIGSTVVVLLARRGLMLYLWAGDSRLYRWRAGQLEQLTQDHSQVEEMVAEGLLRPEQAESHPAANIVTRAVGGSDDLYLDLDCRPVAIGDRFLLCSDGLTKEVPEAEIAALLGADGDAAALCRALLERVMAGPARDNVTLVVAIAATATEAATESERGPQTGTA